MNIERAIKTALEYEVKVRDAYLHAAKNSTDNIGKRIFKVLGQEEQTHVNYLRERLEEWKSTGKINTEKLDTLVPSPKVIFSAVKKMEQKLPKKPDGSERDLLQMALDLEKETSEFYEKMVAEMGKDGRIFDRFMEIEKGHVAIVQAEMDYLNQSGYFFDFQEFAMV